MNVRGIRYNGNPASESAGLGTRWTKTDRLSGFLGLQHSKKTYLELNLNFENIGTILGKHCGTVESTRSTRKSCFPQKAYELAKKV